MKHLFQILAFMFSITALIASTDTMKNQSAVFFKPILAAQTVTAVKNLLTEEKIPFVYQTIEEMRQQSAPEQTQARLFVAKGRIVGVYDDDKLMASFHISFYFDSENRIVGRTILVEEKTIP